MKRRNEMAHISVILAELLSGLGMVEPEAEAAVNAPRPGPRNDRDETAVRCELMAADLTRIGAKGDLRPARRENAHPVSGEGSVTELGDEKDGGSLATPAKSREENIMKPPRGGDIRTVCEPSPDERPVLRVLTGGRELRSDYRRRVEGFPDPALRNSLKLVGGTDHSSVPARVARSMPSAAM